METPTYSMPRCLINGTPVHENTFLYSRVHNSVVYRDCHMFWTDSWTSPEASYLCSTNRVWLRPSPAGFGTGCNTWETACLTDKGLAKKGSTSQSQVFSTPSESPSSAKWRLIRTLSLLPSPFLSEKKKDEFLFFFFCTNFALLCGCTWTLNRKY